MRQEFEAFDRYDSFQLTLSYGGTGEAMRSMRLNTRNSIALLMLSVVSVALLWIGNNRQAECEAGTPYCLQAY